MKNSIITRYASLVLVIGFFISCSSSKFSADKLISEGEYQEAIDKIDTELNKNPSSNLYYQKGNLYALLAQEKSVDARESDYRSMSESFDSARVYGANMPDSFIETKIDSLTYYYWDTEHQLGLSEYEKNSNSSIVILIFPFKFSIIFTHLMIFFYAKSINFLTSEMFFSSSSKVYLASFSRTKTICLRSKTLYRSSESSGL